MKTQGISPKLIGAVIMAILGYLLTQEVVDLKPIYEVIIQAVLVGAGAAIASPGNVTPKGAA